MPKFSEHNITIFNVDTRKERQGHRSEAENLQAKDTTFDFRCAPAARSTVPEMSFMVSFTLKFLLERGTCKKLSARAWESWNKDRVHSVL